MRWIPASLLLASMAAVATVPYSFPAGVPAKASQVNRNFEALDSLLTAQIEQVSDLRDRLTTRVDAMRRDLDSLQAHLAPAAASPVVAPVATTAPDTSWKAAVLPVGSVLGLTTAPGPDGFLPGSGKTWQSVEAFGGISGLPTGPVVSSSPAPDAAPIADSAAPKIDSATAPVAPAAATPAPAVAAKPEFRWYVKVK
jgi:hypothetical protein